MNKKQRKREPLLYIHQPEFQTPVGKMQESFSIKQAEKRKLQLLKKREIEQQQEEVGKKTNKNRKGQTEEHEETPIFGSSNKNDLSSEKVQEVINDYDSSQAEESKGHRHGFSFKRVKSFKEMNMEEKLHYLAHFPKQLPPVPCLFEMEKKAVRGILIDKKDDYVVIRLMDKTEATFPVKELKEVRMIGLN